jgi:hypothetical protein
MYNQIKLIMSQKILPDKLLQSLKQLPEESETFKECSINLVRVLVPIERWLHGLVPGSIPIPVGG